MASGDVSDCTAMAHAKKTATKRRVFMLLTLRIVWGSSLAYWCL